MNEEMVEEVVWWLGEGQILRLSCICPGEGHN